MPETRNRNKKTSRGSALLVTLMVLVGLSLLGLGFVALSETESAIAINERNRAQSVAIAEAGAREVVQWFQNPAAARAANLMPVNSNTIKTSRVVESYTGYYKPSGLLCDLPFSTKDQDRLFGDEDHADVVIERSNAATFLDQFNDQLFNADDDGQPTVVTSIRIYAPPIVGATLDDGFYVGGTRYGLATIRVVAEKFRSAAELAAGENSIARAISKMVVAPFPMPGPTGPLQTAGVLETTGSLEIWWGAMTSGSTLYLKRPKASSVPWFSSWERVHFEHGYDSSVPWDDATAYQIGDVVRASAAGITVEFEAVSTKGTAVADRQSGGSEPIWDTALNAITIDNDINWRARTPTGWPTDGSADDGDQWLWELVERAYEDPWFEVRARGAITGKNTHTTGEPHTFDYVNPGNSMAYTEEFQLQSYNNRPEYKDTKFPEFDYDFWKGVAIAGNGTGGVHYLRYDDATGNFTNGIATKSASAWAIHEPGFYFFDTKNELNPNGGGGVLTGNIDPCAGGSFHGFMYANADMIFTTGACTGINGKFPMPGEPYRDIGYRKVAEVTSGINVEGQFFRDAAGNIVTDNALNQQWDYQDLPWSNSGNDKGSSPGKNTDFDIYLKVRDADWSGGTHDDIWVPVPFTPGCKPGKNTCGTCNCSEPHEPYLNLKYNGSRTNVAAGWYDPTTAGHPKRTTNGRRTGAAVACTAASSLADCTSNRYDRDGGLAEFYVDVDGVIFNEGGYDAKGNATYFGSVLSRANIDIKGTIDIWFDEMLIKGAWPPPGLTFPRVFITSIETDQ